MQLVFTQRYLRKVEKLLSEVERRRAEDEIAVDPLRHPVIAGTGGLRKARVARGGQGKRGGARVIFYFWSVEETIFFLTVYAKNEQEDLSQSDRETLRKAIEALKGVQP